MIIKNIKEGDMLKMRSKLKTILKEKDINMTQLSRKTKINRFFIYKLANEEIQEIKVEYLAKICEFLGCEIQDLIYFEKQAA
jgi:putative transcriptional regulator